MIYIGATMWNSDDSTRIIDGSGAVTVFKEFQSKLFVHGGFRLSFNVNDTKFMTMIVLQRNKPRANGYL